jgi:hypothetical protein
MPIRLQSETYMSFDRGGSEIDGMQMVGKCWRRLAGDMEITIKFKLVSKLHVYNGNAAFGVATPHRREVGPA